MGLQEDLAQIFRDWGQELNSQERVALRKDASGYTSIQDWKNKHLAMVTASGVAAGVTGGFWSYAAIMADLLWCRKVAPLGCLVFQGASHFGKSKRRGEFIFASTNRELNDHYLTLQLGLA
jgi:hypothetical protein